MSKTITVPEEGRSVHFVPFSSSDDGGFIAGQNHASTIAHVHLPQGLLVNLSVIDRNGKQHPKTSIRLQATDEPQPTNQDFARWMPYHLERKKELAQEEAKAKEAESTERLQRAVGELGGES